ncbi:MAG: hypothetical protein B7Y25_05540 [Alphaproteobacteria bacterium 16-39-46]|nr:MAG: hypothetical protein B7Y25_05540 [Alphaproteobacteria bacterium 16-39-46]OZA42615.1 MAG: hypothetical protein B7X84_05440 [Alphaproteobacteria bacterium 17-39-52]HQS84388.1 HipA domain-containing protein [Alphaproteobacteria bacterium]HQS93958.1 HipA domain-containing protein [Alphaproteobacteria bacterium]
MFFCYKCHNPILKNELFHGLHYDCFHSWFKTTPEMNFTDIVLKKDEASLDSKLPSLHTSFFQGKFKKYSAKLGEKFYILKVQQTEYPELPFIEYLSNIIARKLGLTVPEFYLIRFLNEVDAFVVHNFMGNYTPGNLIHIYHFLNSSDEYSVRTILKILQDKIGRTEPIQQFIFMCLFDALIGNHDRHGRNIGLIETKKGYLLSPFYDNPSYIGIEDYNLLLAEHNPRGKIATSLTLDPTLKDYLFEFEDLGYHSIILDFIKKLQGVNFEEIINTYPLSEKRKIAFLSLIKHRKKELQIV